MIAKRKFSLPFFALLVFTISGLAQEKDSISKKKDVKIIESKDIPLDTTGMDMKGLEQMDRMQSFKPLNDNGFSLGDSLIALLIQKLRGQFDIENKNGYELTVHFKHLQTV